MRHVCVSSKCTLHLQTWRLNVGAKWPTSIKHTPVLRWALFTHMRYLISYTFGLIPSCVCMCACVYHVRLWTVTTLNVPTTRTGRTVLPFSETSNMRPPQKSTILLHYYGIIISRILLVLHYVVSNQCPVTNNITVVSCIFCAFGLWWNFHNHIF